MAHIDTWEQFLSHINNFADSSRPLDSMKQAGFTLGGVVRSAFSKGAPLHVVDPAVLDRLKRRFGPPPPVRIHVGRAPSHVAVRRAGGFSASATIQLAVFNEILAELWRVHTFPQHIPPSELTSIITIDALRAACDGVPAGADSQIRGLDITAPPVLSPGADSGHIQMDLPFRLLAGPETSPAVLGGVMHVGIPFDLEVTIDPASRRHIIALTITGTQQAELKITVDVTQAIRPRSAAGQATLEEKLQQTLRIVLAAKRFQLSAPAELDFTGAFSTTELVPEQVGAAVHGSGQAAVLTVGLNMVLNPDADPAALVTEQAPSPPGNFRLAIDETFFEDAIAAMIASGDLAKAVNDKVSRAVAPFTLAPIRVDRGHVTLDNGSMTVQLDCTMAGACTFVKDLHFAARVSGRPQVFEGKLTLGASSVDIDLDNFDAVACTVLGGLLGLFGLICNVATLTILESITPAVPDPDLPVTVDRLLPGSEQQVHLELLQVTASDGTLFANGQSRLVPDTQHTFVYLRIVAGPILLLAAPLRGASVRLLELDDPAPPGDDAVAPPDTETETFGEDRIRDATTYTPFKDSDLGVQTTDNAGLVRFAVQVTDGAGTVEHVHEVEHLGKLTSSRESHTVRGDKPDFGVTVTFNSDVLALRKLVVLNATGNHVGSLDHPIQVFVKQPHGVFANPVTLP